MSCKAVCECADIKAPTFDNCSNHLPADPMLDCGDDESVENTNHHVGVRHQKTEDADWETIDHENGGTGRPIEPIPWTGGAKEFSVNATPEEIESFKDGKGEMSFCKTFEWDLP